MSGLWDHPCFSQLNEVRSARRLSCKSIFVHLLTCFAPHYNIKFFLFKKNTDFLLHKMAYITLCDSHSDMGSSPKYSFLNFPPYMPVHMTANIDRYRHPGDVGRICFYIYSESSHSPPEPARSDPELIDFF